MATDPQKLIALIEAGKVPPVILIGGDNEYLVEQAFHSIRDAVASDPGVQVESFAEVSDLAAVIDSFRTMSLFGGKRLLVVPEVNAFVTRKQVSELYEKAVSDWSTAKTDRKRAGAMAKFLHLLGLIGLDADASEEEIASALGLKKRDKALSEILDGVRSTGKKATRGEGDEALLAEAIARGGAPGTVLLMKTGEVPVDSTTVRMIEKSGAVVICDLTREQFRAAIGEAVAAIGVPFERGAVEALLERLGIERLLADKFSRDIPDLRLAVSEAERLATFAGERGAVTAAMVREQIQAVAGGARYEFASLFAEKKSVAAVAKLRDLIAQARRDDPRTAVEIHYGKFLFPLADEIRQLLGIISFARLRGIDLRKPMQYNRFRDLLAEPLSEYLKENAIVRQKPHPFALHKRFEAARNHAEGELLAALSDLAELEFTRKSGGVPAEIGLESLVLSTQ